MPMIVSMTMAKIDMTVLSCGQHDMRLGESEGVTVPTPGIECRHHWLHHDKDDIACVRLSEGSETVGWTCA